MTDAAPRDRKPGVQSTESSDVDPQSRSDLDEVLARQQPGQLHGRLEIGQVHEVEPTELLDGLSEWPIRDRASLPAMWS